MGNFFGFLKSKSFYFGINRYALGLAMLPYAITKILRTQFVLVPSSVSQLPLEELSGTNIAWAFLGYSAWFQVLLGFLELIPAILLLFRRTAFAGGILMLPMTLNVFLINQALDLWPQTKQISAVLLLLNIGVLLFEYKKIANVFRIIFDRTKAVKKPLIEAIANIAIIGLVAFLSTPFLLEYLKESNALTGDWHNKRPYEWRLVTETVNDTVLPLQVKKLYFNAFGMLSTMDEGGRVEQASTYKLNENENKIEIFDGKKNSASAYTYQLLNDSTLQLHRFDSATHSEIKELYKRRVIWSEGR